jgi:ATP-binding cassette subfamily B multidrug efflux pump
LSTIRDADCIAVIDKGQLTEFGTHDALMALEGGLYRNLKLLQTEGADA